MSESWSCIVLHHRHHHHRLWLTADHTTRSYLQPPVIRVVHGSGRPVGCTKCFVNDGGSGILRSYFCLLEKFVPYRDPNLFVLTRHCNVWFTVLISQAFVTYLYSAFLCYSAEYKFFNMKDVNTIFWKLNFWRRHELVGSIFYLWLAG